MSVEAEAMRFNYLGCDRCSKRLLGCCNCGKAFKETDKIWCAAKPGSNFCGGNHFCSEKCAREAHEKSKKNKKLHCDVCDANPFPEYKTQTG